MEEFNFNELWVGQKIYDLMFGECTITEIDLVCCNFMAVVDGDCYQTTLTYDGDGVINMVNCNHLSAKWQYYFPSILNRTIAFNNPKKTGIDLYGTQPKKFVPSFKPGDMVFVENKQKPKDSSRYIVDDEQETYIDVFQFSEPENPRLWFRFPKDTHNFYKLFEM